MSQEEHDEWPSFESVFHKIAPDTLSARERLSRQSEQAALDAAEIEAALEPLPAVVDPTDTETYAYEEREAVDQTASAAIITAFEPVDESLEVPTLELVTPGKPALDDPFGNDEGWVSHAAADIVITEPVIESAAPLELVSEEPVAAAAPAMDLVGLVEPVEEPLEPISFGEPEYLDPELELHEPLATDQFVETTEPVEIIEHVEPEQPVEVASPQQPAPTAELPQPGFIDVKAQPSDPSDGMDQLRPKEDSGKITFWEGRPKFFGGDERRKARARRENREVHPTQQVSRNIYSTELPQDVPCPSCAHRNAVDMRDPQDGSLHTRCDLCGHIWSMPGS